MKLRVPMVDWKRELAQLDAFLRRKGGVIQIRTSPESPASAFTKALRSLMEHQPWERRWRTIQIDGNNAATHYVSDMITQIERSLELPELRSATVQIGNAIHAGGDVQIRDISVNLTQDTRQAHARVDRIVEHLRGQASSMRLCLFFFESEKADPKELAAFRTLLWERGLEDLIQEGFLLVDVGAGTVPNWPPQSDVLLDLLPHYDEQAQRDAVRDLTELALGEKLFAEEKEARAFAATMVAGNIRPKDLYANLAGLLTRLRSLA